MEKKSAFILGILFSISLVIAAQVITTSGGATSYSVLEDLTFNFNMTVNNTDVDVNITQVNMTIPSSFSFLVNSNGTNAATHTFSNTTTILTWTHDGLVQNVTSNYLWFNATPATPGLYNITVTSLNTTGTSATNIAVTVNDTNSPSEINFTSPITYGNYSGTLILNITLIDDGTMDLVFFNVTNSTGGQNATYTASNPSGNYWNASLLTTDFVDGTYNITVWSNDSAGNANNTVVASNLTFDNTNPTVTFSCSPTSVRRGTATTCTCTPADGGSGVNAALTSLTASPSTTSVGAFTTTCTYADLAGNTGSTTASYTVTSEGGISSGSGTPSFYQNTYVHNEQELDEFQKQLKVKERVKLKINSQTHYVGIKELTDESVTLEIQSDPIEVTLKIGEEKRVDVDADDILDLIVKLNGITNNQADLIVIAIEEGVGGEPVGEIVDGVEVTESEEKGSSAGVIILVILVVVLILIGLKLKSGKK
ncbi:hypothetical protein HN832_05085 [archaeon]|nr:hypothetical protein [archaeon]MBT4532207.1 hypothetical protein [archaeon]MBT7282759.1 hypothetical protein [archaeon]